MDVAVEREIHAEVGEQRQDVARSVRQVAVAQLSSGDRQQAVMQREDPQRPGRGAAHLAGRDLQRLGPEPRGRIHRDDVDVAAAMPGREAAEPGGPGRLGSAGRRPRVDRHPDAPASSNPSVSAGSRARK